MQRTLDVTRVVNDIVPYITDDEDKFMGSLIVDIYQGYDDMTFESVDDVYPAIPGHIKILSQDKNASDNFWELADRIKKDQKSPGVIIEYYKQDVFFDVIRLFKDGVITDEDLADFSDDFRDTIKELKKRFI